MEKKWTPWPLSYQGDNRKTKYGVIQDANGKSVADLRFKSGNEYVSLFTSAPDLYEALESAVMYQPQDDSCEPWVHAARAALARARGE